MTVTKSEWNGYEQWNFEVGGRGSYIVCPKEPAPNKPWVWRTEFFGAFDSVDRELLERGWYLVYHSMAELYGNNTAMEYMVEFHEAVVREFGLSAHPVPFGFSRGGCYAVNFAYYHPDKVGALYLDAPYTNFVSNPRLRATEVLTNLEKAYGLTYEQLADFHDMPNDHATAIGEAGVPIVCVVGLADEAVPFEKNFGVFEKDFVAAGGELLLLKKPDCGHHPHSFSDPEHVKEIADFIEKHAR